MGGVGKGGDDIHRVDDMITTGPLPVFVIAAASDAFIDQFQAIGTGAGALLLLAFLIREIHRWIVRSERRLDDMEERHRQEMSNMRRAVSEVIEHVDDETKAKVFQLMWGHRSDSKRDGRRR